MAPAPADRVASTLDRLAGDGVIGVACSGGGDSLALLLMASRWAHRGGRALHVFTVNHGLRPEAADEVRLVSDMAASLGWPCDRLVWDAARHGAGLQARAREARHRLLARACRSRHVHQILFAHTRDDQAETVWLRLAAGGSWRSAAAMAELAPSPAWPDGRALILIRPCLDVSRAELREVLLAAGQSWVDDPSNADTGYARINVRERLAALALSGFCPERMAALTADLQAVLQSERAAAWQFAQSALELEAWGGARIDLAVWGTARPAIRRTLLDALVMAISGAGTSVNRSRLEPIDDAILAGRPSSGCGIRVLAARSGAAWVIRDNGSVSGRVDQAAPDPWTDDEPVEGESQPSRVFDGRFELVNAQRRFNWRLMGEAYEAVPDRAILSSVPGPARAGLLVGCEAGVVVEIAGLVSFGRPAMARSLIAHRFCRRLLPSGSPGWVDEPGAA